jgi:hypothetical protein
MLSYILWLLRVVPSHIIGCLSQHNRSEPVQTTTQTVGQLVATGFVSVTLTRLLSRTPDFLQLLFSSAATYLLTTTTIRSHASIGQQQNVPRLHMAVV